jgi:hypothetical protein
MDRLIHTYALIKSLYDQGQEYIDSFLTFAIKVIPSNRFVDFAFIQKNLKDEFNLEIPLHVLKTILDRAKRKGYIEQEKNVEEKNEGGYKLTKEGLSYLDKLETPKEVERRTNALVEDIKDFFSREHKTSLNQNQISTLLLTFLCKNIEPLIEYINPSATFDLSIQSPEGYENLLIEYIQSAEQQKPENYKTLEEMVLGSIISVILYTKESSDISELRTKKFKHRQVFLDTNFVFSILELHPPEFNKPAKELFILLKEYGFNLKVFDFTVNEISKVIGGYSREAYRYPLSARVDTLYSSLKSKGWSKTDAQKFIVDLENILDKNEIKIEWTDIDIKTYKPPDETLRNLMRKYKALQQLYHQNHDLAAIEEIKKLRGRPVRKIEDSKACFLTSDVKLGRLNFIEMGHKDNGTVCEVILDRLLTNILWLKNPNLKLSLNSIIAVHSRDLFIKKRIWNSFYDVLHQLRQEGKVKDEDISMLFYHGYIEDVLREFDEAEADKFTPEFVIEKIEEAAKFKEEETERMIREKDEEFLQQLKEAVSKKEQEKEQEKEREWLERVQKIKNSLQESGEREASIYSNISASILTLTALLILYGIYLLFKKWGFSEFPAFIIPFLTGSSGLWGLWTRVRSNLKAMLVKHIYTKKLKEATLDDENKN